MLSKFLTKLLSSVFLLSLAFACRQSGENDGKASIPDAKDLSLTVSIAPLGRAAIAALFIEGGGLMFFHPHCYGCGYNFYHA